MKRTWQSCPSVPLRNNLVDFNSTVQCSVTYSLERTYTRDDVSLRPLQEAWAMQYSCDATLCHSCTDSLFSEQDLFRDFKNARPCADPIPVPVRPTVGCNSLFRLHMACFCSTQQVGKAPTRLVLAFAGHLSRTTGQTIRQGSSEATEWYSSPQSEW